MAKSSINIGWRSNVDVKAGKNIRVDENGYENFSDYWTPPKARTVNGSPSDHSFVGSSIPSRGHVLPNTDSAKKMSDSVSSLSFTRVSDGITPSTAQQSSPSSVPGAGSQQNIATVKGSSILPQKVDEAVAIGTAVAADAFSVCGEMSTEQFGSRKRLRYSASPGREVDDVESINLPVRDARNGSVVSHSCAADSHLADRVLKESGTNQQQIPPSTESSRHIANVDNSQECERDSSQRTSASPAAADASSDKTSHASAGNLDRHEGASETERTRPDGYLSDVSPEESGKTKSSGDLQTAPGKLRPVKSCPPLKNDSQSCVGDKISSNNNLPSCPMAASKASSSTSCIASNSCDREQVNGTLSEAISSSSAQVELRSASEKCVRGTETADKLHGNDSASCGSSTSNKKLGMKRRLASETKRAIPSISTADGCVPSGEFNNTVPNDETVEKNASGGVTSAVEPTNMAVVIDDVKSDNKSTRSSVRSTGLRKRSSSNDVSEVIAKARLEKSQAIASLPPVMEFGSTSFITSTPVPAKLKQPVRLSVAAAVGKNTSRKDSSYSAIQRELHPASKDGESITLSQPASSCQKQKTVRVPKLTAASVVPRKRGSPKWSVSRKGRSGNESNSSMKKSKQLPADCPYDFVDDVPTTKIDGASIRAAKKTTTMCMANHDENGDAGSTTASACSAPVLTHQLAQPTVEARSFKKYQSKDRAFNFDDVEPSSDGDSFVTNSPAGLNKRNVVKNVESSPSVTISAVRKLAAETFSERRSRKKSISQDGALNVADVETIVSDDNECKTRRKTDAGVSRSKKAGKNLELNTDIHRENGKAPKPLKKTRSKLNTDVDLGNGEASQPLTTPAVGQKKASRKLNTETKRENGKRSKPSKKASSKLNFDVRQESGRASKPSATSSIGRRKASNLEMNFNSVEPSTRVNNSSSEPSTAHSTKERRQSRKRPSVVDTIGSTSSLPRYSTASPLHYFEVTDGSGKNAPKMHKKIILPENCEGVRRSSRVRCEPLDWFRNERIQYKPTEPGILEIVGVDSPLSEFGQNFGKRLRREIQKQVRPKKMRLTEVAHGLSIHTSDVPEGLDNTSEPTIPILDEETNTEYLMECIKVRSQYNVLSDKGQVPTAADPMTMCKPLRHEVFASGILTLRPLQEKPKQRVNKDLMVFCVQRGKLLVTIHRSQQIVETQDMFCVPAGNSYTIRNLRNEEAALFFTQVKNKQPAIATTSN